MLIGRVRALEHPDVVDDIQSILAENFEEYETGPVEVVRDRTRPRTARI